MTQKPGKSVFVSATSRDLRSYRQTVKDALIDFGVFPRVQEHFPPDYRTLIEFLTEEIRQSDAVVCLVGRVFGEQPYSENGKAARSYSQIEYDVAREAGKPIYVFFAADDCGLDEVPEQDERQEALQAEHRRALQSKHKCDEFSSDDELHKLIAKMVLALERDRSLAKLIRYVDGLKDDPEFAVWNQQRYFELQVGGKSADFNIRMFPKHLPESLKADLKSRYQVHEAIDLFGQLVIVGEPGSGKTTALKRLALNYARGFRHQIEQAQPVTNTPVPVYIWLPDFNLMRGDTPYDRLIALIRAAFQRQEALEAGEITTLLRDFRLALLLDGHNEMGDRNLKEFQEGLKRYARTHKQHNLIITSRTYNSEFGTYELPVFELRELRYPEDFAEYIRGYLPNTSAARRLMRILESNLRARQLAGNPLLLRMIILVFQFEGTVPNSRGALFQKIGWGLLRGWELNDEVQRRPRYWFKDKHVLLSRLGYAMKEEGLELSRERAEEIFREATQLKPDWFSMNARPRQDFQPPDAHTNWQDFIDEVMQDHLLFQRSDGKAVRFWHQTMQEYFAACCIWNEISPLLDNRSRYNYSGRKKLKRRLSPYMKDRRWHEILAIVGGLIGVEEEHELPQEKRYSREQSRTQSMIVRFIDTIWHHDKVLAAMCLGNVERLDGSDRLDSYLRYFRNKILIWGIFLPRVYPWFLLACLLCLVWGFPIRSFPPLDFAKRLGRFEVAAQLIIAVGIGSLLSLQFFRFCALGIKIFDKFTSRSFIRDAILALRYIRNINQDKTEALLAQFERKIENDFSIGELTRNTIQTGLVLPQRDEHELILMLNQQETRIQALEGLAERGNEEALSAIENLIERVSLDNLTYGAAVKAITGIAKSLPIDAPARRKVEANLRIALVVGESYGKRTSAYWGLIDLGITDIESPRYSRVLWVVIGLFGLVTLAIVLLFFLSP